MIIDIIHIWLFKIWLGQISKKSCSQDNKKFGYVLFLHQSISMRNFNRKTLHDYFFI